MGGLNPGIIASIGRDQQPAPNLLATYGQFQQIQQNRLGIIAQQQALQTQHIKQQQEGMQLAQQQYQVSQDQEAAQALQTFGGDTEKASQYLKSRGNQHGFTLEKEATAIDEIKSKITQQQAAASKAQAEAQSESLKTVSNSLGALKVASPALQPVLYQALREQA